MSVPSPLSEPAPGAPRRRRGNRRAYSPLDGVTTVAGAQARIGELRTAHRGNPKEILTDPEYPPYDPHRVPGVYFLAAHPVRRVRGVWRPETFKIGGCGDPYVRMRPVLTNNPADIELLHVIHEPNLARRLYIEDELMARFDHLAVNGEWFFWDDEVDRFIRDLCVEQCGSW